MERHYFKINKKPFDQTLEILISNRYDFAKPEALVALRLQSLTRGMSLPTALYGRRDLVKLFRDQCVLRRETQRSMLCHNGNRCSVLTLEGI